MEFMVLGDYFGYKFARALQKYSCWDNTAYCAYTEMKWSVLHDYVDNANWGHIDVAVIAMGTEMIHVQDMKYLRDGTPVHPYEMSDDIGAAEFRSDVHELESKIWELTNNRIPVVILGPAYVDYMKYWRRSIYKNLSTQEIRKAKRDYPVSEIKQDCLDACYLIENGFEEDYEGDSYNYFQSTAIYDSDDCVSMYFENCGSIPPITTDGFEMKKSYMEALVSSFRTFADEITEDDDDDNDDDNNNNNDGNNDDFDEDVNHDDSGYNNDDDYNNYDNNQNEHNGYDNGDWEPNWDSEQDSGHGNSYD